QSEIPWPPGSETWDNKPKQQRQTFKSQSLSLAERLSESQSMNATDYRTSYNSNSSQFDAQATTTQLVLSASTEFVLAESGCSDTTGFNTHCDSGSLPYEAATTNFSHFGPPGSEIWEDQPKEQRGAFKRASLSEALTPSSSETATGFFHDTVLPMTLTKVNETSP
ncbi:unnamed protein product, partial [Didymodactylos carnosus]